MVSLTIKKILEKYGFFGTTAKRCKNTVIYNYASFRYRKINITIETIKENKNVIPSRKIVLSIVINGKISSTYEDFINELNKLTRYIPKKNRKT